jgi:uncharacterized repeat protein (TIGR01451 family)
MNTQSNSEIGVVVKLSGHIIAKSGHNIRELKEGDIIYKNEEISGQGNAQLLMIDGSFASISGSFPFDGETYHLVENTHGKAESADAIQHAVLQGIPAQEISHAILAGISLEDVLRNEHHDGFYQVPWGQPGLVESGFPTGPISEEFKYPQQFFGSEFPLHANEVFIPAVVIIPPAAPEADLVVKNVVSNPTPFDGTNVVYTVTVTNDGPDTAFNTIENDPLPSGISYVLGSASGNVVYNSGTNTLTWDLGDLPVGSSAVETFVATVTDPTLAPVVDVDKASTSTPDLNPDPMATSVINPLSLSDSKDITAVNWCPITPATNVTINVGDVVQYTFTISNNTNTAFTGPITIADSNFLPNDFKYFHAHETDGSFNLSDGVWTITGGIAANTTETLTFDAKALVASADGSYTDTLVVSGTTIVNPAPPVTVNVNPDVILQIVKSDNDGGSSNGTIGNVTAGQAYTYTIAITNSGPSELTSLNLADTLPTGFTATGYSANEGTYDNTTGTWTGLSLASGDTIDLTITGSMAQNALNTPADYTVNNGQDQISNVVTVTVPSGVTNTGSSTATDTDNLNSSVNLSIVKSDTDGGSSNGTIGTVIEGESYTYTIAITNSGPSELTSLNLADTLPTGFTATGYNAHEGTYDNTTGAWTGLSFASGDTIDLTITGSMAQNALNTPGDYSVNVNTGQDQISNVVTVTVPTGVSNTGSSTATDTDNLDALSILKTVASISGDTINYNIAIDNPSSENLSNVVVTDPLTGLNDTIASLAPGVTNISTSYTVTSTNITNVELQSQLDALSVPTQATIFGSNPSNNDQSYWGMSINDPSDSALIPNATYQDYCIDTGDNMSPGQWYPATVYSSELTASEFTLLDKYSAFNSQTNHPNNSLTQTGLQTELNEINYIDNTIKVGATDPSNTAYTYTYSDIQMAIWMITGQNTNETAGLNLSQYNQQVSQDIVSQANEYGTNFMPTIGDSIAVILVPEVTGGSQPQITIAEIPLQSAIVNIASVDGQSSSVSTPIPDLTDTKEITAVNGSAVTPESSATINAGGSVDYTFTVSDSSANPFVGPVSLTDNLSSAFTYTVVSESTGSTFDTSTGVWSIANGLSAGQTDTLVLKATAALNSPGTYTDTLTSSAPTTNTSPSASVTVNPDVPVANSASVNTNTGTETNAMFTLDVSSSMAQDAKLYEPKIDFEIQSLQNLLISYGMLGSVDATGLTFSYTNSVTGHATNSLESQFSSVSSFIDAVSGVSTGGNTDYSAAITAAQTVYAESGNFTQSNAPTGVNVQNVAYFITDGGENEGDNTATDASLESSWQSFLSTHNITSYAIALGANLGDLASSTGGTFDTSTQTIGEGLYPIGTNTQDNDSPNTPAYAIGVDTVSQLPSVLDNTVTTISNNILTQTNSSFGPAGAGYIESLSIGDGATFTFNGSTVTESGTQTGGGTYSFASATDILTINDGSTLGTLAVNLETGAYTYTAPTFATTPSSNELSVPIDFTLMNSVGNTASAALTLDVNYISQGTVSGSGSNETLTGLTNGANNVLSVGSSTNFLKITDSNSGNDTVVAGSNTNFILDASKSTGNDLLISGPGNNDILTGATKSGVSDTFEFERANLPSSGTLSVTINNFQPNSSVLNLSDLLTGEGTIGKNYAGQALGAPTGNTLNSQVTAVGNEVSVNLVNGNTVFSITSLAPTTSNPATVHETVTLNGTDLFAAYSVSHGATITSAESNAVLNYMMNTAHQHLMVHG